jgi:hypothetical protein
MNDSERPRDGFPFVISHFSFSIYEFKWRVHFKLNSSQRMHFKLNSTLLAGCTEL